MKHFARFALGASLVTLLVPSFASAQQSGPNGRLPDPPPNLRCVSIESVEDQADISRGLTLRLTHNYLGPVAAGAITVTVTNTDGETLGSGSNGLPLLRPGAQTYEVDSNVVSTSSLATDNDSLAGRGEVRVTITSNNAAVAICGSPAARTRTLRYVATGELVASAARAGACDVARDAAIGCRPMDRTEGGSCGAVLPAQRTISLLPPSSPSIATTVGALISGSQINTPMQAGSEVRAAVAGGPALPLSQPVTAGMTLRVGVFVPAPTAGCPISASGGYRFWDRQVRQVSIGARRVWRVAP